MKFRELLTKTHFMKKYTNHKPKIDDIIHAIQTATLGPAAGNLQPIHFIILEDPETISMVAQACHQPFINKAPYVIVVTSDSTQMKRMYDEKGDKYLKQNVGAAIQNFTLQLAELGISSSMVAPFSDLVLHNKLGIPDGKEIEMVITAGEGMGEPMKRRPPALINKIFYGGWGNKNHRPVVTVSRKDM